MPDEPNISAPPTRAGRCSRAWILFLSVLILTLAADLVSKDLAFNYVADAPVQISRNDVLAIMNQDPRLLQTLIPMHEPVVVIPYGLQWQLVLNSGAVFGAGQGKRWFFIGFTIVALAFAFFMFVRWHDPRDRWSIAALAMIISGGIGNLYDRITFACVRDFIHPLPDVMLPFGLTWPSGDPAVWPYVSNVADAFLLIGIGILLIRLWRAEPEPKTKTNAGTESQS